MQVFTPRAVLLTKLTMLGVPVFAAVAVFVFRWSQSMPNAVALLWLSRFPSATSITPAIT